MSAGKKRGRPPGKATLEKRRINEMLSQIPPYLKTPDANEQNALQESIDHSEKIRQEILKTYKHGVWTPDEHAYSMASLGDESLEGFEKQILDDDDKYARRAKDIREEAGKEKKRLASIRANELRTKNCVLISKIKTSPIYTIHKVAKIIHNQWGAVSHGQRLVGEPTSLTSRGDGKTAPSVRTITRWLSSEQ